MCLECRLNSENIFALCINIADFINSTRPHFKQNASIKNYKLHFLFVLKVLKLINKRIFLLIYTFLHCKTKYK